MAPRDRARRHQPWWRTAMAGAAVAAVISAMPAAALAETAPGPVDSIAAVDGAAQFSFSTDGVGYSPAVPELFAGSPRLVPGESVAEELWVRNENTVAVDVSVAALSPTGAGEASRVRLTPSPVVTLQPGEAAPLQVRLWLLASAGNATQNQRWTVRLRVSAREAAPAGSGELGNTGGLANVWPLAVASLLAGSGTYLASRRGNGARATIEGERAQ